MPEHVSIAPLHLASLELPDWHPEGPGACEVFGFLVRDGDAKILVDTGVGEGSALIERLYRPRCTDLATALANVGCALDEVTAVVNSHLHFDHHGNNRRFPGVPIFVQDAEYEAAQQTGYTVPDWLGFPGSEYVLVDDARRIAPHVELLPTPGHTAGHQSVLVRAPDGPQLVVAQAAYTAAEFESAAARGAEVPEGSASPESYADSLRRLHGTGAARAYFSHDPRVWSRRS